jgi:hypothetical protein
MKVKFQGDTTMETIKHGDYTIEIEQDDFCPNPREDDNLGTMVCFHGKYNLGDKHDYRQNDFCSWNELEAQIQKDTGGAIILPIRMYDHSGIGLTANPLNFGTYPWNCPWDSMWVGFIYVSKADIRSEYSIKLVTKKVETKVKEILIAEVETYNKWQNGEFYAYSVKDKDGKVIDSCCGFYDLEYCKKQAIEMAEYCVNKNENLTLTI